MGGRVAILLAIILCCCSCGQEIPLNQIYALRMPDTKNVEDLEPDHYGKSQQKLSEEDQLWHWTESLTYQITEIINDRPQDKPVGLGIVVVGTGKEALENIKKALTTSPPKTLPTNEDLTLFFYARELGSHVNVKSVQRSENDITIKFEFVSHGLRTVTNHFALIALGKLVPGQYRVNIVPSIRNRSGVVDDAPRAESLAKKFVCRPFSFSVE